MAEDPPKGYHRQEVSDAIVKRLESATLAEGLGEPRGRPVGGEPAKCTVVAVRERAVRPMVAAWIRALPVEGSRDSRANSRKPARTSATASSR